MLCAESEQLVTARLSMAQEVLKAVKKQLGAEVKKTQEAHILGPRGSVPRESPP